MSPSQPQISPKDSKISNTPYTKPPLTTLLSTHDFTHVASESLSEKTWAFYSSGATDLISLHANTSTFDRIWWRPRILRNVRDVCTKTKILGFEVNMPLFVSPAALATLVHPEGEKAIARACGGRKIGQCISTNASFSFADITACAPKDHPFFFQLYVNKSRPATAALLHQVISSGAKAIFLTVDAPAAGKREADERVPTSSKMPVAPMSGASPKEDSKGGGFGRTMGEYIDASLDWEDLAWLRSVVGEEMPIVLKGVQTAADVKMAMEHGVKGVVLSNHGGRSLDGSPPPILVLLEIRRLCPEVFGKVEIYVDGGIRRGTDILKCLCLGATSVGMGRHFLYALNYGQEGVEHLIDVMKDELETSMRLVGITSLNQAHPGLVNTLDIDGQVPSTMGDTDIALWKTKARL